MQSTKMTPETTPNAGQNPDTILVRLHPDSPLAKEADKNLTANAQLMQVNKTGLLAHLIQEALGPAFTVRAA